MKEAKYTDAAGRQWAVLLPDGMPDGDATLGIPLGPPSMGPLGLPEEVEVRLHNQLFARRLFSAKDVRARRIEVFAALQAAFAIDMQRIVALYLAPPVEASVVSGDGTGRRARKQVT